MNVMTPATDRDATEAARLRDLATYEIIDTAPEPQFDTVVELARALFDAPGAAISLIDNNRQWFKAQRGMGMTQTPKEISFCLHTIERRGPLIVADARNNPVFASSPLVTDGPKIRFYAGIPLISSAGNGLGALCIVSDQPREEFCVEDVRRLTILRDIVISELELRRLSRIAALNAGPASESPAAARFRIRMGLDYASLLDEIADTSLPTNQLMEIAETAWTYCRNATEVVSNSVRMLRRKVPTDEYRRLLARLPGFKL